MTRVKTNFVRAKMAETNGKHTIILLQLRKERSSRTFADYETISMAMSGKEYLATCRIWKIAMYLILFHLVKGRNFSK